jgi:organic radical activating enzyme
MDMTNIMQNLKNISDYFCVAPWTHTYLSPQSERRLCCASREEAKWQKQYIDSGSKEANEYIPITLEEHWNSDHMKSVRKRILNGENIPECQVCNNNILNLHSYRQYFTETLFPNKIEEILKNTSEDGATTLTPISFDYRIYNLCNFKCRMCGEQLSSSWESEKRLMNMWNPAYDKWMIPENKIKIENFQSTVAENELWQAVKNNTIEEIYWVGGEPLMYEIHWDIMKYLVESGHSKNVTVRYNTNLSRTQYKGFKLYELLPNFKHVNMCCSQDATNEVAEWIRTGLKWDVWLQNFKDGMFLNNKFNMESMVIDVTLTLPGMLDMKNLIDLAIDLGVKSYVKISFDFDPSAIMSPMCLPRELLDEICTDLIEYESHVGNHFTKVYSDTFKSMLERPTFKEKYGDSFQQGLLNGKQRYQRIADHRKDVENVTIEQIFSRNNKILDWWNKI